MINLFYFEHQLVEVLNWKSKFHTNELLYNNNYSIQCSNKVEICFDGFKSEYIITTNLIWYTFKIN